MSERTVWTFVALFVAASFWLLAGAVLTVAHRPSPVTIATAPDAVPVIYEEEP